MTLKRELEGDIQKNIDRLRVIDTVDCMRSTDDRYNLRLTERTKREQNTLLCNEKRVREVYSGELEKALDEVRNSISNL